MRQLSIPTVALVVLLPGAMAAQSVHVVDVAAGAGSDFVSVSAAISAANDGDVILVRAGEYDEYVVVDQKSLVIHADTGAVDVCFCAALGSSVYIHDNTGTVWIEDAELTGSLFYPEAARVTDSAAVLFRNCQQNGNVLIASIVPFNPPAVSVTRSGVYFYESEVNGSPDLPTFSHGIACATMGFPGITLLDSRVWLYGTSVTGGRGFSAVNINCPDGGDGGDGVISNGATSEVHSLGATVRPGVGGLKLPGGTKGTAWVINGGIRVTVAQVPRFETVGSPVRDDGTITATQTGVAGDLIWTYYSTTPRAPIFPKPLDGGFFIGAPLVGFPNGLLPAGGILTRAYPMGDLGTGVEAVAVFAQSIMRDAATGRFVASAPTLVLLVDEAF